LIFSSKKSFGHDFEISHGHSVTFRHTHPLFENNDVATRQQSTQMEGERNAER
jgi:hypothetical protein